MIYVWLFTSPLHKISSLVVVVVELLIYVCSLHCALFVFCFVSLSLNICISHGFSVFETNALFSQNFGTGIPLKVDAVPLNFYHGDTINNVEHAGNFADPDTSEVAPLPLNFYHGETSNYVEHSGDFSEADLKPMIGMENSEIGDEEPFFGLPEQHEMRAKPVKDEYCVQPSDNVDPADLNYAFGEQFLNATNTPPFGEGLYLETNDLSKPVEEDPADFGLLDEYLNFFDVDDDSQFLALDSSQIMGIENSLTQEEPPLQKVQVKWVC